jgi:hypothetical protein
MDLDRERRIREIAYDLWERAGRPAEGADEYWYLAERQLQEEEGGAPQLSEEPVPFVENETPDADDAPRTSLADEALGVPDTADQTTPPKPARRRATRKTG